MALVKSPDKSIEESKEKQKYRVTPRYDAWLQKDKFIVNVALPGVSRDNLKIKALEDYLTLRAERENVEYALDLDLNFKIEPKKVNSKYSEGLLHLEIERYKPLEHAHALLTREEKGDEEDKNYHKISPRVYRHISYKDKKVDFELSIPGVSEDQIDLKILPTWFHLTARRPEDEIEYSANQGFGIEIVPEKTEYEYYNGLLKIHAEIKDPMEDAKEVAL
jgi:HSP20 family molecular chaperone IbpA